MLEALSNSIGQLEQIIVGNGASNKLPQGITPPYLVSNRILWSFTNGSELTPRPDGDESFPDKNPKWVLMKLVDCSKNLPMVQGTTFKLQKCRERLSPAK